MFNRKGQRMKTFFFNQIMPQEYAIIKKERNGRNIYSYILLLHLIILYDNNNNNNKNKNSPFKPNRGVVDVYVSSNKSITMTICDHTLYFFSGFVGYF